jgi:endonuclease YncB( thermonuclease family)
MRSGFRHRQFSVIEGRRNAGRAAPARRAKASSKSTRATLPIGFAALAVAVLVFTFPDWSRWAGFDDAAIAASSGAALVGIPSVTDADTIKIDGIRVRLAGIDAPEMKQPCQRADGTAYRCGENATAALEAHIGRRSVECRGDELDRYGRTLAVCYLGAEDLNAWLVAEGWAVAYRHYSTAYVPQEDAARAARRGIWAGMFAMPWDWRHTHG